MSALYFLINTAINFVVIAMLLRVLLQWVRADFYNEYSQAIVKITEPLLAPGRRFIPKLKTFDLMALIVAVILIVVRLLFIVGFPALWSLPLLIVGELFAHTINIFSLSILFLVIGSWLNPTGYHPMQVLLAQLTSPLLAPAQRLIPPLAGLDFSPMVVLILLQALDLLIRDLLYPIGSPWAFGL